MKMNHTNSVRIAILDMYEGAVNEGMRCIREIIANWGQANSIEVTLKEYDVRLQSKVPDLSYDIYISTGGPGSPLESEGSEWEKIYFEWVEMVNQYNHTEANKVKKPVFFICHSYQLACRYFKVGTVAKRNSTAFGVFPVHMTDSGKHESVFEGLNDPLYAVDSRDFQLVQPNKARIDEIGAKILAIEKERKHVPYERAVMAMRFNQYFIGTQFHPEADPVGMSRYLERDDKRDMITENYGEEKWQSMITHLRDPDKILNTYSNILPNFLSQSFQNKSE